MLRSEIVRGLNNLLKALDKSRVPVIVEGVYRDLARAPGETKTIDVLQSYQSFMLAYNTQFTDVERKVLATLDIAEFANNEWWTMLIMASSPGPKAPEASSSIGRPLYRLRFVIDYLPTVISLLDQKMDDVPTQGRLIVVLPEDGERRSSPARVVASIESVMLFYEAFADISNKPASDLVLLSCDSGADKVLEFAGLPEIVLKVRTTLLEIWRNAIYYRERKFSERLELIARALPILSELNVLEDQGQIAKEKAELLRRDIMGGATRFIESGSSIPEMSEMSLYVPRQVLAPKEALLLGTEGVLHAAE